MFGVGVGGSYSIGDNCCLFDSGESFWSGWNCPAWCSGGRRPLIQTQRFLDCGFLACGLALHHAALHR